MGANEHGPDRLLARAQSLLELACSDLPADGLVELALSIVREHTGATPTVAQGTLAIATSDPASLAYAADASRVLGTGLRRQQQLARLTRSEQHFQAAQRISHVGSYDFEIASNTNDWSDQLFRIYGREPGSFMPSYERFLELVHPEDRDAIVEVHQQALAELSTYQMEERIVWPDGQVRTLASWGEVVPAEDGTPARMVGICWDITASKATAAALQSSSERFQQLLASAPDVVLVTDAAGVVLQSNDRLAEVLGWNAADVTGKPVDVLVPQGLQAGETWASHADGRTVPVDISTSTLDQRDGDPSGAVTIAFLRDATARRQAAQLALRLHDDDVRRRHALEINDNVVQGLASALYLLDLGRHPAARAAAEHTLAAARTMMSDLLDGTGERTTGLQPGELVRTQAHVGSLEAEPPGAAPPAPTGALRILLVDDAEDIRLLLRLNLHREDGFDVVGEAGDGEQALRLATELRPDVVVLDLSMPVMDGLQAARLLLEAQPDLRIVALSGFDEERMRQAAFDAGAHAYLEKGQALTSLVEVLRALLPEQATRATAPDGTV